MQDDEPALAPLETLDVVGAYDSGGTRFTMYSDGSVTALGEGVDRRFKSLDALRAFIDGGMKGSKFAVASEMVRVSARPMLAASLCHARRFKASGGKPDKKQLGEELGSRPRLWRAGNDSGEHLIQALLSSTPTPVTSIAKA